VIYQHARPEHWNSIQESKKILTFVGLMTGLEESVFGRLHDAM
jgi:hypothetical protein